MLISHSIISDFFQVSSSRCQYLPMSNRHARNRRNTGLPMAQYCDRMHRNTIVYRQTKLFYGFRFTLYFFVYDYISRGRIWRYTIVQNVILYGETRKGRIYFILIANQSRKVIWHHTTWSAINPTILKDKILPDTT